jgi:hypothetical protein
VKCGGGNGGGYVQRDGQVAGKQWQTTGRRQSTADREGNRAADRAANGTRQSGQQAEAPGDASGKR